MSEVERLSHSPFSRPRSAQFSHLEAVIKSPRQRKSNGAYPNKQNHIHNLIHHPRQFSLKITQPITKPICRPLAHLSNSEHSTSSTLYSGYSQTECQSDSQSACSGWKVPSLRSSNGSVWSQALYTQTKGSHIPLSDTKTVSYTRSESIISSGSFCSDKTSIANDNAYIDYAELNFLTARMANHSLTPSISRNYDCQIENRSTCSTDNSCDMHCDITTDSIHHPQPAVVAQTPICNSMTHISTGQDDFAHQNVNANNKNRTNPTQRQSSFKPLCVLATIFAAIAYLFIGTDVSMLYDKCPKPHIEHWKNFTDRLHYNLYGQHVARLLLLNVLPTFLGLSNNFCNTDFCRSVYSTSLNKHVLVMSLHGWRGTGKTHIANLIAHHLYNDIFYRLRLPAYFDKHREYNYGGWRDWIVSNATRCNHSLVVVEDVDQAPDGFLNILFQTISQLKYCDTCTQRILFLLTSSSAAGHINQITFNATRRFRHREDLLIDDFREILTDPRHTSSWWKSFYSKKLIDILIPFMPLDHTHVRKCIVHELEKRSYLPTENIMTDIEDALAFVKVTPNVRFSSTGCKRVADKVDLYLP